MIDSYDDIVVIIWPVDNSLLPPSYEPIFLTFGVIVRLDDKIDVIFWLDDNLVGF